MNHNLSNYSESLADLIASKTNENNEQELKEVLNMIEVEKEKEVLSELFVNNLELTSQSSICNELFQPNQNKYMKYYY